MSISSETSDKNEETKLYKIENNIVNFNYNNYNYVDKNLEESFRDKETDYFNKSYCALKFNYKNLSCKKEFSNSLKIIEDDDFEVKNKYHSFGLSIRDYYNNKTVNKKCKDNKTYTKAYSINRKSTNKNAKKSVKLKLYEPQVVNNKKKILLVDDTNTIRQSVKKLVLENLLVKNQFDVLEAKDGIEMLNFVINDQFEGNKIKLIITDENMEYMSGSFATEIIRKLEKESKIKRILIVSLTAFSDEDTLKEIYRKGADEILSKPLSNTAFSNFVNANINKMLT